MKKPFVLMVNPHIEDFAAFDHFSKPLGLWRLAAHLADSFTVRFVNAMTRLHPSVRTRFRADGTGHFPRTVIPKPACLRDIPLYYKRYGLADADFISALKTFGTEPDWVFVTGGMTYWYAGVAHTVSLVRSVFPGSRIVLGGTYTALMPEHAMSLPGIDRVVPHQDLEKCLDALEKILETPLPRNLRPPDYGLAGEYYYAPVLTSTGCVFQCSYCVGPSLAAFRQFPPESVADTITRLNREFGVTNFAFYDDALLFNSESHIDPILDRVIRSGADLRFHTPNGLHIRFLTAKTAGLMKRAGFRDIRLSLESSDPGFQQRGGKTTSDDFRRGMEILKAAEFRRDEIRVYTLLNVPGQDPDSVEDTVRFALSEGARPMLAYYSPVPGTPDFDRAAGITNLSDPLFHNNTVYLRRSGFPAGKLRLLKDLVRNISPG